MLAAYFDESGTHGKGSHAVAIGGFIAEPDKCVQFNQEWQEALKDYGLPYFHMRDFAANHRSYRWGRVKRGARFARLMSITKRAVRRGFLASLDVDAWKAHVTSGRDQRYFGNSMYTFCAGSAMWMVAKWVAREGIDDGVSYTFERGANGWREVRTMYGKMLKKPKAREIYHLVGELEFKDKRLCTPLQAADIAAFTGHKGRPRVRGLDQDGRQLKDTVEGDPPEDLPVDYDMYDIDRFAALKEEEQYKRTK